MRMKTRTFLFPYWCQKTGWWLAAISLIWWITIIIQALLDSENCVEMPDWMIQPTLFLSFILPSAALFLVCLSREKQEDEYIEYIRSRSVFVVAIIGFITALIYFPFTNIGVRLLEFSEYKTYMVYIQIFINPIILTLLYLIIFKGSLFINWIKSHNDGQ